ncbi:BspA family leucine-rich repeat surface protein [Mycoplasma putrefaciens]|uniref:PARCEL domain-containing protein n=1 Tax=Mycoplasma putrefaciens Mput9231 TaxID=1292033 RepID=M9WCC1_9MOLU|nr:BspA family leucine-rich repeat surface protein [Mycoplasma putrefaciens]AGJ90797.1 Hypothetical protein, predicted transmembrane protein, DUF285 family [Mycoplasma putrefaciens Mput9231]
MKRIIKALVFLILTISSLTVIFLVAYNQNKQFKITENVNKVLDDQPQKDTNKNKNYLTNQQNNQYTKPQTRNEQDNQQSQDEGQNIYEITEHEKQEIKNKLEIDQNFEKITQQLEKYQTQATLDLINELRSDLSDQQHNKKAVYSSDMTECLEIGYHWNPQTQDIQIDKMPATIKKVPDYLPWQISSLFEAFEGNVNEKISGLEKWNTYYITDMQSTFKNTLKFNGDIRHWNTSNVRIMKGTFSFAYKFNQPIGNWDVANVITMSEMFYRAKSFNQDLSRWNVKKVNSLSQTFAFAFSFNKPLNWKDKVSNVLYMDNLFYNAWVFNQDLSEWDTSNVIDMSGMFNNALAFNNAGKPLITKPVYKQDGISYRSWVVTKVKKINGMFIDTKSFTQDLSKWTFNLKKPTNINFFTNLDQIKKRPPKWID